MLYCYANNPMNIVISNSIKSKVFTNVFQNIKHFCEHVNILFRPDGLYAQGMDNSHISIFELNIPSTWFDAYSNIYNSSIQIGINVGLFYKILNTRDDGQEIFIKYDKDAMPDKLLMHFITSSTATSKSLFDKHFELPLMEIDAEIMHIPSVDYQAEFSLASVNYFNLINQLKLFGTDLHIKCDENEIRLSAKSQDAGNMSVVVPIDELSLFAINEGEQLNLSFSLAHMVNICSFHKASNEINLAISMDYPLRAIYYLENTPDDGEDPSSKARLNVFLAPRVDDE